MLYDLLSCPSHLCSLLGTSLLEYSCDREQTVISGTEMKVYKFHNSRGKKIVCIEVIIEDKSQRNCDGSPINKLLLVSLLG